MIHLAVTTTCGYIKVYPPFYRQIFDEALFFISTHSCYKSAIPDESLLKATLGATYPFFQKLEDLTADYSREWKFYNSKSGWTYKVFNKKKALFYVTPYQGNFNFGMALRESERETLLSSNISNDIREKLLAAEKYPEGFALRLNIKNEAEFSDLVTVLGIVIGLRK